LRYAYPQSYPQIYSSGDVLSLLACGLGVSLVDWRVQTESWLSPNGCLVQNLAVQELHQHPKSSSQVKPNHGIASLRSILELGKMCESQVC